MRLRILGVAALLAGALAGCDSERPALDETLRMTKIAFVSSRDGNIELYVMNADGSGQKNLTNNSSGDQQPSWSPDGKKIAFMSYRDGDGNSEIYVMNADGSEQKNLTNNPANQMSPSWSPDGKKIAFSSDRDGNGRMAYLMSAIYVMNADGSEQKKVTNTPGAREPSWSPDGKEIAFSSSRDIHVSSARTDIHVMKADGSEEKNLTNTPGEYPSAQNVVPSWSPDGKKIAFSSHRDSSDADSNFEIYVMNADGSEAKRLTNNPGVDFSPSWSPDGTKIVFFRSTGGASIYMMNADGTEQKRLTDDSVGLFPSWSPYLKTDGK